MRLVEDHRTRLRQDSCIGRPTCLLLDREVGKEQVVVDDDQLTLERLPPHARDEAAFPVRARRPQARLCAGIEFVPQRRVLRQRVDLCPVARLRRPLPVRDRVKLRDLLEPGQQRRVPQRIQLMTAKVVCSALHVADLHRSTRCQHRLEEWYVFEVQLLLQVLGAGRDDYPLTRLSRQSQCGQKVRESLSGSSSCFDDQAALLFQRCLHRLGHLVLSWPMLEGERRLRQQAAG